MVFAAIFRYAISIVVIAAALQGRGAGAAPPCIIPPADPAPANFANCSSSGICQATPGKILGWLPAGELAPVGQVPPVILEIARNRGGPGYVTASSKVQSKNVVYGVNALLGGGYGVFFSVDGGKTNESRFGFGDGWQASIRDQLHNGNWNPTQAGSGWAIGTPATVSPVENGFAIHRYNLANFFNQRYDFVQNDSIRAQSGRNYRGRPANHKTVDGCNDPTLDDEARSEFDFAGDSVFVTDDVKSNIPVLRFRTYIEYAREPHSVRQFFHSMTEDWRTYVSPGVYAGTKADDTDLSLAVYSWGLRLRPGTPFQYEGFIDTSGAWQFSQMQAEGTERTRSYIGIAKKPDDYIQRQILSSRGGKFIDTTTTTPVPLVVVADGTSPTDSRAIGLYYPYRSMTNSMQTVGVKDQSPLYYEDRMLAANILAVIKQEGRKGHSFVNLTLRIWTSGLLEPRRTMPGVREAMRTSVYVLYGTPAEIQTQVEAMEHQPDL